MWAELFLSNQEHVLKELDLYVESLQQYREAIAAGDQERLIALLDEGRRRKEEVDG
jgi:prephenate dehydrogenase